MVFRVVLELREGLEVRVGGLIRRAEGRRFRRGLYVRVWEIER